MSNILNIGVLAMNANQSALQTVSHNIANVNTPGYSRQQVVLQNVPGQFSGSGYFGKGVDVLTVTRSYNDFLTRQAASAQSIAKSDETRLNKLNQLENYFKGGGHGLGSSISDMLNSFSDVVSAPTDLTARSVALTRADETAKRFNQMNLQLDQMRIGNNEELKTSARAINNLAGQIAKANQDISRAMGGGQSPNDLLDQRDQLIRDLNKYVQTSNVQADDGSINIFLAGSQALVLGTKVGAVSVVNDQYADMAKAKLAITVAGSTQYLDEATLGGGEVSGLLRFQNHDLVESRNLLGRMAMAIGTRMNEQQALGLDLNGDAGSPIFKLPALPDGLPAANNNGTAKLAMGIHAKPSGTSSFVATDYEVVYSSPTTLTITRTSDGTQENFDLTAAGNPATLTIDGLDVTASGDAITGDRFMLKPFSSAAATIATAFASPRGLAMASPITAIAGANNAGTVTLENLAVRSVPTPPGVTLTFTGPGTYTRSDTGDTVHTYVPSEPIEYTTPAAVPMTGWSLTLKGVPQPGDTYTVDTNTYPQLNADNAEAMLALRDEALFDGGPLTDGYASAIALIGTRIMSAQSASAVSSDIATNLEKERTSVAGVNLDEEAARLIQYQQAYQASGKMMQVAQTIFDTLIDSIGR